MAKNTPWVWVGSLLVLFSACKEPGTVVVPDNTSPSYDGVSTLLVENYVNRIYIDLIGREPVDVEMERDVAFLRSGELKEEVRSQLVEKLQSSTEFVEGDSSYKEAYYYRFYELSKARMLEGVSDGEIYQQIGIFSQDILRDSLSGDSVGMQKVKSERQKLYDILTCQIEYQEGTIGVNEVYARMLFNYFYDQINMNSINFIRASFNDLFFRYHTQAEFDQSFQIIEFNIASVIFGKSASNKLEYIDVLVNSREFYEGMVRWAYKGLLAREPDAVEIAAAMENFFTDHDFQKVQLDIMVTDEYANF